MTHLDQFRALAALASFAALAACGDVDGDYFGIDSPAVTGRDNGTLDPSVCPSDAPVLGQAGTAFWQTFDISWQSGGLDAVVGDYMYFVVPDDIVSLAVTVDQGSRMTAINQAVLGGTVLLDLRTDLEEPPFLHAPVEAATFAMPVNGSTYPRLGCLAIDPVAYDTSGGETGKLHIVTRRDRVAPSVIDLHVIVVGDTDITDEEIDDGIARMEELYANTGQVGVGNVTYQSLDWHTTIIDDESSEAGELRRQRTSDDPFALNVFFIQDFAVEGVLGVAAGTPGPNGVPETAGSGVIIGVDSHLDGEGVAVLTNLLGETLAHEAGHQLGLFHTSEAEGTAHDPIADTPECSAANDVDGDGELTATECDGRGGRNFMFWTAGDFDQTDVTAEQAAVLRDNVIARPQ